MASQGPICDCARRDLVFTDHSGNQDVFVWEHGQRVARYARLIAALPGVNTRNLDRAALEAAALYHDAGWICQLRAGTLQRADVLSRPTSDQQHDQAAALLTRSLAEHLRPRSLETAAQLIRQMNDREAPQPEAVILAEADNLDEIGCFALWHMVRRHAFEGKGIAATLQTWERQREFSYWEARINKSLRIEAVREIARRRLEHLDRFMALLGGQCAGDDVAECLNAAAHQPSGTGSSGMQ
jgi:hypothetical protein